MVAQEMDEEDIREGKGPAPKALRTAPFSNAPWALFLMTLLLALKKQPLVPRPHEQQLGVHMTLVIYYLSFVPP